MNFRALFSLCLLFLHGQSLPTYDSQKLDEDKSFSVKQLIKLRLEILKKFSSDSKRIQNCSDHQYVYISEYPFGNSGNQLIEFTHGLWMAHKLNATFIVPDWIQGVLTPFNTSLLATHHCFTLNSKLPTGVKLYEVTSEESFFLFKLFRDSKYEHILPPLNQKTIADISLHFLKVYTSLWSHPSKAILAGTEWIIRNKLENSLRYTAAHKRSMEGGCSKVMGYVSSPSDFSMRELPMYRQEWQNNLYKAHPLCDMPIQFLQATQALNHRNESKLFVAFDGKGEIDSYLSQGAIFSKVLEENGLKPNVDMKYIDMFVAMNSDLFILNPRSTFSWQIYLIRVCLALDSVPVVKNNDFYLQSAEEIEQGQRPLWVSWGSVIEAFYESHHHFTHF